MLYNFIYKGYSSIGYFFTKGVKIMENNKDKSINTQDVEPITYEEAFKKLGAFIQKTRKEEREKESTKEGLREDE